MYKIDYISLIQLLLPVKIRLKVIYTMLKVMILPIRELYNDFTTYRIKIENRLNFNGNVQYLEYVLNKEFLLTNNEIFISDLDTSSRLVLRNKSELQQPRYLYNKAEGTRTITVNKDEGSFDGDFTVNIPSYLNSQPFLQTISNIVNYYKQAGKQYKIQVYEQS